MAKRQSESPTSIRLKTGTVFQKQVDGTFYFRYQLNGRRKCVSLKTEDEKEAIRLAESFLPVIGTSSIEVISAHVKEAKGLEKTKLNISLDQCYAKYLVHPDRATPATVSEQLSYESTFNEFINWFRKKYKIKSPCVSDINHTVADAYAQHLRKEPIGVSTHNRKLKRIRRIFLTLTEYYTGENPFQSKTLFRKEREEQNTVVRRQAFTKEEELALIRELSNPARVLMNKDEMRIIYTIGMFTGQRLKDCVLLQWQNIDMSKRRIWVKQSKTGKEVTIPMAQELYDALLEAQGWRIDQYVCPKNAKRYNTTDDRGKNIGNGLVNIDAMKVITWIGLEPAVKVPGRKKKMTVYGFHSLRHSFASHCAQAGVPKAVLLSILGTESDIADKYYTHVGDEAQQHAINLISSTISTKTLSEKVDEAIMILKNEKPSETSWNKLIDLFIKH